MHQKIAKNFQEADKDLACLMVNVRSFITKQKVKDWHLFTFILFLILETFNKLIDNQLHWSVCKILGLMGLNGTVDAVIKMIIFGLQR